MTDRPASSSPFVDLIRLLSPQATLWGAIEGTGRWGVAFRERHDLLFFRVDRGTCLLLRKHQEPLQVSEGDFLLIRTIAPFSLATDREVVPLDSEKLVATTGSKTMRLGTGEQNPFVVRGGRFVFNSANEQLLIQLLPTLVHISIEEPNSARTRALLAMNEEESRALSTESDFIVGRLMELLLVEILRSETAGARSTGTSMLRGLGDAVISKALMALHSDPARTWTTSDLSRVCGSSRSALIQRFTSLVGVAPMQYLYRWRMGIAKNELRRGERSVEEIAFLVGFQSGAAFSRAFSRSVGCPPSSFAKGSATTSVRPTRD